MSFKNFLKKALKEKHLSASKLAKLSGVSNTCISNYLHGYTQPNDINLEKIQNALGEVYESGEVVKPEGRTNRLSVEETARLLETSPSTVRAGLITGALKFGAAVKKGNSYTYLIWPKKFTEITGIEVQK